MNIETISDWNDILYLLVDVGYSLWQCQFSIDSPEGFHAWFTAPGHRDVEIITRSRDVHDAILAFRKL